VFLGSLVVVLVVVLRGLDVNGVLIILFVEMFGVLVVALVVGAVVGILVVILFVVFVAVVVVVFLDVVVDGGVDVITLSVVLLGFDPLQASGKK
jgi:hypothetical protein